MTNGINLNEPTGVLVCVGDGVQWKLEAKREWAKYNFGCFGCWVADGKGGLAYVHEDDYNEEMWNELKRSSQRRMQNANTPKM